VIIIFGTMLGLIIASIVLELILPTSIKERLGVAICWTMMAITMTFLGLSTVGLVAIIGYQVLLPAISG
jgi:hypothetical protein